MILAERIRCQLESMKVVDDGRESSATASIGVTSYRALARSLDILMRKVDAALCRAKEQRRNQVVAG
jgi:PleD family two-component response regulator